MAIKAGRVGVNWRAVDNEGNIIDGGGGGGVTDVKVDGVSVVADGVANITLPPVITGDLLLVEVEHAVDADFCVWTGGGDETITVANYGATGVVIGETDYTVLAQGNPGSETVRMSGVKALLQRGGRGSASSDYRSFYGVLETGVIATVRFNGDTVITNGIRLSRATTDASGNFSIGYVQRSKRNADIFKFYKLAEV